MSNSNIRYRLPVFPRALLYHLTGYLSTDNTAVDRSKAATFKKAKAEAVAAEINQQTDSRFRAAVVSDGTTAHVALIAPFAKSKDGYFQHQDPAEVAAFVERFNELEFAKPTGCVAIALQPEDAATRRQTRREAERKLAKPTRQHPRYRELVEA
jgi:hypothetical protein